MNEQEVLDIAKKSKKNIPKRVFKNKVEMTFRQHFPNWMDFEPKTIKFKDIQEVLDFEDIKWWSEQPGFYGYFVQVDDPHSHDHTKPLLLMALTNYNKEYYGCTGWYVLGYISGDGIVDLPIADGHKATHKAKCCTRIAESLIKDGFYHFSDDMHKQVYEEMGWEYTKPVCCCDCGFNKL